MANNDGRVTLKDVARGAAVELFEHELERIVANIADPNTSATAKRKITLEFIFAPDETREDVDVRVGSKVGLAAVVPAKTHVFIGLDAGKPVAVEFDPRQPDLPGMAEGASKVTPLRPVRQAG